MVFGVRPRRVLREAATRYLNEHMHLASIEETARHLSQLDSFIVAAAGSCAPVTLQPFIEQRRLFQALPAHLAREQEACGLRWEWEVPVPELKKESFAVVREGPAAIELHVRRRDARPAF